MLTAAGQGRGLIPARAGNTYGDQVGGKSDGAHPRSRGEHRAGQSTLAGFPGSSPLARGTLLKRAGTFAAFGLIPARAGNTWGIIPFIQSCWAHPRSRGEHVFLSMIGWGWCGLIPARAGNTLQPRHTRINTRAHPRSRGEHCPAPGRLAAVLGSSPLARGTLTAILRACGRVGLIPARAGNTGEKLYSSGVAGAHPRSRGEHIGAVYVSVSVVGSSPLARGTRFIPDALMQSSGLIPARAGNTRLIRSRVSEMRAHPRSRGEHSSRRLVIPSSLGSSPLARGTRLP